MGCSASQTSSRGSPLSYPSPVNGERNRKSILHTTVLVPYFAPFAFFAVKSSAPTPVRRTDTQVRPYPTIFSMCSLWLTLFLFQYVLQQLLHRIGIEKPHHAVFFSFGPPRFR